MLEPGYAYIRISAFQADTAADFESTLERLQAGSGDRLRGLVLDLRSNPGGLLTTAVQIADALLEEGGTVSTQIGRASCRERLGPYGWSSGGSGSFKKNTYKNK